MIELREYIDALGRSPFSTWFEELDGHAAVKVTTALERIAGGHTAAMKARGEGVSEYKIDFGPEYRVYFAKDGERLVILLAGGTKKLQQRDIRDAKAAWSDYKLRKRKEI